MIAILITLVILNRVGSGCDAVRDRQPRVAYRDREVATPRGDPDEVLAIADKWEIDSAVVGQVKAGGTLSVRHAGEIVAELPEASLADDKFEKAANRRPNDTNNLMSADFSS